MEHKYIKIEENFSETKEDMTSKIKRGHFILGTNDTQQSMEQILERCINSNERCFVQKGKILSLMKEGTI